MASIHLASRQLIVFAAAIFLSAQACQTFASGLATAGWIEKAVLLPQNIMLHAKLDTGARTSSINAPEADYFDRDGQRWVRFRVTNKDIESVVIEAPIVRESNIKRHFGEKQTRPVIRLQICIGHVLKTVEVNLVDRSGLNYQLLVGRNFLKDTYLVHSGSSYTLSPDCED